PGGPGWAIANRLVFSKVKQAMGSRTQIFISGGAPLNRDLIDWYGGIGIRIFEGYGLTETSPVIALNNPADYRAGSVGKPLKNVEVCIAEDGEILVRGPSVFKGYWNKPEEAQRVFDGDWFRTGDIGRLDEDGFLYITDRKKDLIKTSGGKFLTPQPIEAKLKANSLVAEAAVIGERRKFPSVILAPNFTALEDWATHNKVSYENRRELIADLRVEALYKKIVEQVNEDLAHFEQLKKFVLISDELSIADGSLTPTLKLRRRIMEERYRTQLDALYKE
ncbi:MAG: AMP-binding protein, partial [Terriglobales bacterium]